MDGNGNLKGYTVGFIVFLVLLSFIMRSFAPLVIVAIIVLAIYQERKMITSSQGSASTEDDNIRKLRAINGALEIESIDTANKTGRFHASEGDDIYTTTFQSCTCPDFTKRKKPCKHMYRLKIECGEPIGDVAHKVFQPVQIQDYTCLSGGYCTYANWEMKGIYPETNRKRTSRYYAANEEEAYNKAIEDGFIEPIELKPIPFPDATYAQKNLISKEGFIIPPGANKMDASEMITSILAEDEELADTGLAKYAFDKGINFSCCCGKHLLEITTFSDLVDLDKVVFYVYAFHQTLCRMKISDPRKSPHYEKYNEIGTHIMADQGLMKSFKMAIPDFNTYEAGNFSDMFCPSKNTMIYKYISSQFKDLS